VSLQQGGLADELRAEWSNMLEHQLPALPPVDDFWDELPRLFDWLDGHDVAELPAAPFADSVETGWTPPPTITTWRTGVPLESVRFAAANRLCVDLGYQGARRLIEPYSLRRTLEGNLLLAAVKVRTDEIRTYRVDRIESVAVTTQPFRPRYAVEFATAGPMSAPPTARGYSAPGSSRGASTARYTVECSWCGKRFPRAKYNTRLNPHKDKYGHPCSSRHGFMV
jgi:hypothetical protein